MSDIPMDEKALDDALAYLLGLPDPAPSVPDKEILRAGVTAYLAALPPVVLPSREAVEAVIAEHVESAKAAAIKLGYSPGYVAALEMQTLGLALLALIPTEN